MIRLAVRGVLSRPAQSAIVAIGLVLTLVGFAGLTAGARSTTASLNGDIGRAWDLSTCWYVHRGHRSNWNVQTNSSGPTM